ncbi:MAG: DUF6624 domain-containing protein [Mucilaginibacter sp.]
MKTSILIIVICTCFGAQLSAQVVKKDSALMRQIALMFKDDQFWRVEYMKVVKKQPSSYDEDTIQKKWAEADSINQIKAKAIINTYGYPGYDLVGERSNTFWAIVQHCDDDIPFQERVLKLMAKEVARNNADKNNYAYLTDRVLVNKKKKQIYGTQVHTDPKTHIATPLPLKYPKAVNALRKKMGLGTEEEYLKSFQ